ncbi:MAG: EAL domain-containing protein [Hahellaceae bacterium]|nr:EAL domain-containing protein [Hahellaceae bacterium]MCP5168349.1 EAL domain-containing protein [Hahellaceae bacterium]
MNSVQFAFKGFEVSELLSRHGETCAWRAFDVKRQRSIILKSVHSDSPPLMLMEKLKHEYEIGRRFKHPHIIRYLGLLTYHHRVAIVTEDFSGQPLAACIPEQGFPIGTFLRLALQLVDAIAEIHRQKVIHKDVTPYNVVFNAEKRLLKIIDFGMATRLSQEVPVHLRTSLMGGNLPYVAPEQTGRLNRVIDHRTDYYSLGVTLFEMLCGQRPFVADDPLELVHAHLTRKPPRISQWRSDIPPILDDILGHLMAKNAEDRYQSMEGLRFDLEECMRQWREHQSFSHFEIGSHDLNQQFAIPQCLYGRDHELDVLVQTFENATQGLTELMFINGYSGMGKTALVNEIKKPLANRKGYFVTGKFEQLKQNVPFSALSYCLDELIGQMLTESDERLGIYRHQLIEALGNHASLLKDLVPGLELILGAQPSADHVSDSERLQLLPHLMQNFMRVFAVREHPLVLFLDDLQWADHASLQFLEHMLDELQGSHLLVVGAYRTNEVQASHPLLNRLARIRQIWPHIQTLQIGPLNEGQIAQLVTDTLHQPQNRITSLARYLFQKTHGNPFYVVQLLRNLHQEGHIFFDFTQRQWRYKLPETQRNLAASSLVDVVVARVNRLPQATKRLLHFGACIGSQFDSDMLAELTDTHGHELREDLWPAIEAGLLQAQSPWTDYDPSYSGHIARFRFPHDRVQQAAYELFSVELQQKHHLQVARCLHGRMLKQSEGQDLLFDVVNQYNTGAEQLPEEERLPVAELNLQAAIKSRVTTAFDSAAYYAQMGILLAGEAAWQTNPGFRFQLGCVLAEAEGMRGRTDEANELLRQLQHCTINRHDQIQLKLISTSLFELQGRYPEAMGLLMDGLDLLGLQLPRDPAAQKAALNDALEKLPEQIQHLDTASLLDRRTLADQDTLSIMRLLMRLWTPCYVTREQDLLALVSISLTNYTLKHGLCEISPFAYTCFSFTYGILKNDYCLAYQFGKAGVELAERFGNPTIKARTYLLFGMSISNWQRPLDEGLAWLEKSAQFAQEAGDRVYGSYASYYLLTDSFIRGRPLEDLARDTRRHLDFLGKTNQPLFDVALSFSRTLSCLGDYQTGYTFDQPAFLKKYFQLPIFMAGYDFSVLCQRFWSEKKQDILTIAESASQSVPACLQGTIKVAETAFLSALIFIREGAEKEPEQREHWLAKVAPTVDLLRDLTDNCTNIYLHKFLLLKAELARISNERLEAMELYETAIEAASESQFIAVEALANEYYAEFWEQQDRDRIASLYVKRAWYLYRTWGNHVKAKSLERRYPHLLLETSPSEADAHTALLKQSVTQPRLDQQLDWLTALKATQAIMDNIQSANIAEELVKILAQNAGATRALLFKSEKDKALVLQAAWPKTDDNGVGETVTIDDTSPFPGSLLQYIQRVRTPLLIADTKLEQRFYNSHYRRHWQPRSALAMPLLDGTQMSGVLYFESNQYAHAFNQDRQALLSVLFGHVVAALRNARLYDELRDNEQRFRDLIDGSIQGIVIHRDAKPLYVNHAFASMVGYTEEELMAMESLLCLLPAENTAQIERVKQLSHHDRAQSHFEVDIITRDGTRLVLDNMSRAVNWHDGGAIQSTLIDITDRVAYEHQIEHMASHDSLSRLPNRMLFQDRLQHALIHCDRHSSMGAVLLLDLDKFKEVNDTLGHSVGDELIKSVAKRLTAQIKESDTVARLGGDEFAILLEDVHAAENVANTAQRILDALAKPFNFDGHEIFTSGSIGVAIYPNDSLQSDELIRFADLAMYSAKNENGNQYHFFQQEMNLSLRRKKALANDIRAGLGNDEFYLVYQPQIQAKDRQLKSFETLLRWRKADGTLVPPCEFLPVAEQNGLINTLGEWVLREAARQAAIWQQQDKPFSLAVNVSAVQFHQSDLAGTVEEILRDTGLDAHRLELEITESLLMQNIEAAIETMLKLNKLGVRLSIDDFGTGYSSLSYLKRFPVQKIKVDRSFVRDLGIDDDSLAITRAIIELGHILDLKVVAEGVETEEQISILQSMGCDLLQGFHFGMPLLSSEAENLLNDHCKECYQTEPDNPSDPAPVIKT